MFHVTTVKPFCDVILFEQETSFRDRRGSFSEIYRESAFADFIGQSRFVQENESISDRGVFRGMHYQFPKPQGKLVRVVHGRVYDFVVDLRELSATFGVWAKIDLNCSSKLLWVPPGFAHGFYVMSDIATVNYKVTEYYDPGTEHCMYFKDPDINMDLSMVTELVMSDKDSHGQSFRQCRKFTL